MYICIVACLQWRTYEYLDPRIRIFINKEILDFYVLNSMNCVILKSFVF